MPITLLEVADAGAMLAQAASAVVELNRARLPDLAHASVLLPNLQAGGEFRKSLLHAARIPGLMLPRITTYAALAGDGGEHVEDSARVAWLYGALRARNWFDDAARWGVCRELDSLFDELTARNLALPVDLAEFRAQLRLAYGKDDAGAARGIDFEARLVGEMWFAIEGAGAASPAAQRKLKLAQLAAAARGPLVAVLNEAPSPEQQAFFSAWARREPVSVIQFAPGAAARATLTGFLDTTWPALAPDPPDPPESEPAVSPALLERAESLRAEFTASPLVGRISLIATTSGESEAKAAALSIRGWLLAGAASIAVVAQDRLVARRLRALLERENILVSDEAGWKLSTTSAATVVARWLDTVEQGFYYRDLLDLLKSPFALSDIDVEQRRELVHALERRIRRDNVIEGLDAVADAAARDEAHESLLPLVTRLQSAARAQMPRAQERKAGVPLGAWLTRLDQALQILGIGAGLDQDAAGCQLRELLRARGEALAGDRQAFSFHEWRSWLNAEFEAATFRDSGIVSPVVFTQLAATRLRRFDKVLVLGADAVHLPGPPAATRFFNQRVRAALGLPTATAAAETLRRDLIGLASLAGELRFSWQGQHAGESNAPAPLVDILQAVHLHAFGNALPAAELAGWLRAAAHDERSLVQAHEHGAPCPSAPGLTPARISTSGYASLVACPYQFFARHMLRLNESDEVEEQVAKRDFGEAVHRILKAFHEQVAEVSAAGNAFCLQLLEQLGEREFAPLVARNPLAAAYGAEWRAMIPAYLQWQGEREAAGWRFAAAEVKRERSMGSVDTGFVLTGRLDRIDVDRGGAHAVLDYKTRPADLLVKQAAAPDEDVQLATYALLQESAHAQWPAETGFVALERQHVKGVVQAGDLAEIATRSAARLEHMFAAVQAGAALPAQGVEAVCTYCEMRGLCRRNYWERE